jgi:hypothetical protein
MAIAVVLASPARAKGPSVILVCGPGGCLGTKRDDVLAEFGHAAWDEAGARHGSSPSLRPYYELRGGRPYPMTYGFYVPGAGSLSVSAENGFVWRASGPAARRELGRLATRLRPYPTPVPYSFVRNTMTLRPTFAFLPLLGPLARAPAPPPRATVVLLSFWWERPNPWSGAFALRYDPPTARLFRDGAWFQVPLALARRLR